MLATHLADYFEDLPVPGSGITSPLAQYGRQRREKVIAAPQRRYERQQIARAHLGEVLRNLMDSNLDSAVTARHLADAITNDFSRTDPQEFWHELQPFVGALRAGWPRDARLVSLAWNSIIGSASAPVFLAREPFLRTMDICLHPDTPEGVRRGTVRALWNVYVKIHDEVVVDHRQAIAPDRRNRVAVGDLDGLLRAVAKVDTSPAVQAEAQAVQTRIEQSWTGEVENVRQCIERVRGYTKGLPRTERLRRLQADVHIMAYEARPRPQSLARHVHIVRAARTRPGRRFR